MNTEKPEINPLSSAAPLHLACAHLRDAWTALRVNGTPHNRSAPYSLGSAGSESQEFIWKAAEFAIVFAADSVLDHLRALALSYEAAARSQTTWSANEWPGVTSYTSARAILEGCALVGWFTNPDIDAEERLRRGARIRLWSLSEEQAGPNPPPKEALKFWREKIEDCGMRFRKYGRGWGIEVDGEPRNYSHQAAIKELVPTIGRKFYHEWSGLAHHVSWAFADWGRMRVNEETSALRFVFKTHADRHVILVSNLAGIVTTAGNSFARYFGRSSDALLAAYEQVFAYLEAEFPHIEAAQRRMDVERDGEH
ncbi:hypothetical protein CLV43_106244 [Umezawaea tangerina]|uniref:Uncharacterized protein n=1 Tax=Umezawaea tangerina TaxID=84725 RepID=A0A2T0T4B8_9PSEU|nr:hypothetical protein CLV43_106244 [Umezawaea tangerina]